MIAPLLALALAASAQVIPPRPRPGEVVQVVVRGAREAPSGLLLGRPLRFFAAGPGRWRAYGGLPVEAPPGAAAAEVKVPRGEGLLSLEAAFTVAPPGWREQSLSVPPEFTAEKPPEVEARLAADRAAFAAAFAQPPRPPLFSGAFAWPARGRVTGRFGDLRTFNGETHGQHYGTDLPGKTGAPVRAANDGEVVLVRDAWASGLTVVLSHGADLYTVYFHLSRAGVAAGDRVRRGARIGAIGASGRASGPHLHWGAKVGDLYVDPESLLRLTGGPPRPSPAR